jgi:serine/threonine protein kinase
MDPALTGRRLGVYHLQERIGAGGMGEVYRARDTRLGRDVAIKVLPDLFAADPDRLTRFEREARVLAALNHPHIGAIYGFEESGGVRGLVLELVEGPTLADRLATGPLSVLEALTIASQIAEALEAAHAKGIIHRDLKPANVKVTPAGVVKVLDFGLAKTWAREVAGADLSQASTMTITGTREGALLGTAAYMSPEQARGTAVDQRADVWAFGCVLFEMLTGRAPFQGETLSDTLARILEREPDWSTLPAAVPGRIRVLLRTCLQKDPIDRDAGVAKNEPSRDRRGTPRPGLVSGRPIHGLRGSGSAAVGDRPVASDATLRRSLRHDHRRPRERSAPSMVDGWAIPLLRL